jgi:hypothetical protein
MGSKSSCTKLRDIRLCCTCSDCSVDITDSTALAEHFYRTNTVAPRFFQQIPTDNKSVTLNRPKTNMIYKGDVKKHVPHGWGTCRFTGKFGEYEADDILYGQWYKGIPHGIFHWYSGCRYVRGPINVHYKLEGYCVEFVNGRKSFEGMFADGKRNGTGARYIQNFILEGRWEADVLQEIYCVQKNGMFIYFGATIKGNQEGIFLNHASQCEDLQPTWQNISGNVVCIIKTCLSGAK